MTKFCTDCYDLLYAQAAAMSLEAEKPEQLRRRLAASISMAETVQPVLELAARCARQTQPARVSSKAVRLAMRRIQSDYAQPLSLEQVAAEVHLTPEYFSRIFKEEVGGCAPAPLGADAGIHRQAGAGCGPGGGVPQRQLFFHDFQKEIWHEPL